MKEYKKVQNNCLHPKELSQKQKISELSKYLKKLLQI